MLHNVNASYNILGAGGVPNALSEISGHPEDKWGGAVMAALQIKNLPTGAGDDIKIDVTYAKGDTKAVISTSGASPNFVMFGNTGVPAAYQSIGFGPPPTGLRAGRRYWWHHPDQRLGYPWCVQPQLGSLLVDQPLGQLRPGQVRWQCQRQPDRSWHDLRQGCVVRQLRSTHVGRRAGTYSCNPDFNVAQVGLTTRWTPVKNLTFSAEVGAFFLDQKMTGAATLAATAPKPTTVYEFKDQSTVFLNVRAQRNF